MDESLKNYFNSFYKLAKLLNFRVFKLIRYNMKLYLSKYIL